MRRLDIFFVFLLYALALVFRLYVPLPKRSRHVLVWHLLAWGFLGFALVSIFLNDAPLQSGLSVILSLGRGLVFWAALMLLPWRLSHLVQAHRLMRVIVIVNLGLLVIQTAVYVSARGVDLPGDWAMGLWGLANDSALLSFTWAAGVAIAWNRRIRKLASAALLAAAGLASAFLTGTGTFLVLLPLLVWLASPRARLTALRRPAMGVAVALVCVFAAYGLLSRF